MTKHRAVQWMDEPEERDYPAAASYLALLYKPPVVGSRVRALRRATQVLFHAKDILRASGLPLLPLTNAHVKHDEAKILAGTPLSPLLLVRKAQQEGLIVADGYHRLCAVYAHDENAVIPCRIVG